MAARAARGHHCTLGQLRKRAIEPCVCFINQHIAQVLAFADCAEHEAAWQFRGQILETVHGKIGFAFDERHLEFFGEHSFGQRFARLHERSGLFLVAGGFDDFNFKGQTRKGQTTLVKNQTGLRKGKRTATGGDDDGFFGH